jgi:FkbM family methyltransferase
VTFGLACRRLIGRARAELATRGIEVHRTRAGVRRTLPAVLIHYRRLGLAPATIIDVGVGPGTPQLYEAFPGVGLVLVEPLEEWRGHLEQVQRERPTDLVMAAAGSHAGSIEIAVHRVPACSSMLGARRGDDDEPGRRLVPMVRLDDVARERRLPGPFVVKVDVEGGELEVLAGALDVLRETELVLLEVSLFELVAGAPQFHDVVSWMLGHGFVVADFYNGHNRPLDGALAQLDVAFVRLDGRFRREHAYATPAQADSLYRSWGF